MAISYPFGKNTTALSTSFSLGHNKKGSPKSGSNRYSSRGFLTSETAILSGQRYTYPVFQYQSLEQPPKGAIDILSEASSKDASLFAELDTDTQISGFSIDPASLDIYTIFNDTANSIVKKYPNTTGLRKATVTALASDQVKGHLASQTINGVLNFWSARWTTDDHPEGWRELTRFRIAGDGQALGNLQTFKVLDSQFNYPSGDALIATSPNGKLLAVLSRKQLFIEGTDRSARNFWIRYFNLENLTTPGDYSTSWIKEWQVPAKILADIPGGLNNFQPVQGLSIDNNGNAYISCGTSERNQTKRISKFSINGTRLGENNLIDLGLDVTGGSQFCEPEESEIFDIGGGSLSFLQSYRLGNSASPLPGFAIYALNKPRTYLAKTIKNTLIDMGVTIPTGSFILDAGDTASYSGSGQTWIDTSGNASDFFLGANSSTESADLTFNGVSGSNSKNEFFSVNNSLGYLTKTAANNTSINSLHKDNSKFTLLLVMKIPSSAGSNKAIFGTRGATSGNTGVRLEIDSATPKTLLYSAWNSGTQVYSSGTGNGAVVPLDKWTMLGVSLDEPVGILRQFADGKTKTSLTANYNNPASVDASFPLQILAGGNNVNQFDIGTGVAAVIFLAGYSMDDSEQRVLWEKIRSKLGV